MSLILKSIELANIRSHEHVLFEPVESGITAIYGSTGAGKSSIVDSLAWILYGVKPHGVKRFSELVKEGVDASTEKVFAEAILEVDGSELKIKRSIVSKKGDMQCDVWERKIGEQDFVRVIEKAVSDAEPYIRKRLLMDKNGYLAAVFVQQKQVDQLIEARPAERGEVIERLTGISSISEALNLAKQNFNSLKKNLKDFEVNEEDVQKLHKEFDDIVASIALKSNRRDLLEAAYKQTNLEYGTVAKSIENAEKIEEQKEKNRAELMRIEANLSVVSEDLNRLLEQKEEKKKIIPVGYNSGTLVDIENDRKRISAEQRNLERELYALQSQEDNVRLTTEKYGAIVEKSRLKTLNDVQSAIKNQEKKITASRERMNVLRENIASLKDSNKRLDRAKTVVSSHDGSCPTCLQKVANPENAVNSMDKEIADNNTTIEALDQEYTTLDTACDKASLTLEKLSKIKNAFEKLEEVGTKDFIKEKEEIKFKISSAENDLKATEKFYQNAKRFDEIKKDYDNIVAQALKRSNQKEKYLSLKQEIEDVLNKLEETKSDNMQTMRKKMMSLADKKTQEYEKFVNIREEVSVMEERKIFLEKDLQIQDQKLEEHRGMLKNVEISGNSVKVIEEFRENRVKAAIPLVTNYASDLIARFSDGHFVGLKLDKDFNASVVLKSGVERKVGLLSGGELSEASLALRIAISMMLNAGSSKNVIILDEVLTAQDVSRSESILLSIKDVCQGQVIMISHGSNTSEIADKIFEL